MKELLKAAKGFTASEEGHYLTNGTTLFRLEKENADPSIILSLFQNEFGRPTEERCEELLPKSMDGSMAVPIVGTKISIQGSKAIRKGRKTTYEIIEWGIYKASTWIYNDEGSVIEVSFSFSFFDNALIKKAASLTRAHYGSFNADTLLFFQEPESGRLIGAIRDSFPVFILCPVLGMLGREENKISFSSIEITEILDENMRKA